MSPNNFTWGHFMKTEWLTVDVTSVGSTDRVERDILRVLLVFLPVQATFVVGEPLCDLGIPS